jgi:hypothetical protein
LALRVQWVDAVRVTSRSRHPYKELPVPRSKAKRPINGTTNKNGVLAKNGTAKPAKDVVDDAFELLVDDEAREELPLEVDVEQDELEAEYLPDGGSVESHIDDPIRMYLMQMGEIPMLSLAD